MKSPPLADASHIAPGLLVGPGVEIPDDTEIDPYVTVHSGVQLGRGVSLGQGAILGRRQRIDSRSNAIRRPDDEPTFIGDKCMIGCGSIVVAGAQLGDGCALGDSVLVREGAVLGSFVMIGRGGLVGAAVVIHDRTRLQAGVLVAPRTTIEEDVMIGPYVVFIGDPTMGRDSPGPGAPGVIVRKRARIGTAAIFSPPLEIGEEAVIGAGSFVRDDVPPRTVVVGVPARVLRAVGDDELLPGRSAVAGGDQELSSS